MTNEYAPATANAQYSNGAQPHDEPETEPTLALAPVRSLTRFIVPALVVMTALLVLLRRTRTPETAAG